MSEDDGVVYEVGMRIMTSIGGDERPMLGDVRSLTRYGWGVVAHYRITAIEGTRLGWLVSGVIVEISEQ